MSATRRRFAVPITVVMALSAAPVRARAAKDDPPAEVLENLDFFQNMGLLEIGNFSGKTPTPSPTVRPIPSVTPSARPAREEKVR